MRTLEQDIAAPSPRGAIPNVAGTVLRGCARAGVPWACTGSGTRGGFASPRDRYRMALGARVVPTSWDGLAQGMGLTLPGVAVGSPGAIALTRVLRNHSIKSDAIDPITFTVVALLLFMVALLACLIPARARPMSIRCIFANGVRIPVEPYERPETRVPPVSSGFLPEGQPASTPPERFAMTDLRFAIRQLLRNPGFTAVAWSRWHSASGQRHDF